MDFFTQEIKPLLLMEKDILPIELQIQQRQTLMEIVGFH